MPSYRSARGPMPDQRTLDAFLSYARQQPRSLPLVGHVRHDSQMPGAVYGQLCRLTNCQVRGFGKNSESTYGGIITLVALVKNQRRNN